MEHDGPYYRERAAGFGRRAREAKTRGEQLRLLKMQATALTLAAGLEHQRLTGDAQERQKMHER
jgi:hypothetical protein